MRFQRIQRRCSKHNVERRIGWDRGERRRRRNELHKGIYSGCDGYIVGRGCDRRHASTATVDNQLRANERWVGR